MLAQAVNASNLANAATPGFRADLIMAQQSRAHTADLASRAYATTRNTGVDFAPGSVNRTGRDLDVAINGSGWFAVQGEDGVEGYSRRGDLRINALGQITDGGGNTLLGNAGPIALPPYSDLNIGADGTISIVPLGESPNTLAVVDRIKLVNPPSASLEKGEDGLMRTRSGAAAPPAAEVRLLSGSLEASNVDSVAAMVQMIELSRQFEQHTRMMNVAKEMDQSSTKLMSFS
jgi:flagellar basal-body rod protein FlgF